MNFITDTSAQLDNSFTHPDDRALMEQLHKLAVAIANEFKLCLLVVEHKRRPHPGGALGICYQQQGRISIVARFRTGKEWWRSRERLECVIDTTIHEVAHLPSRLGSKGLGDGPAHRLLQHKMTAWARSQKLIA